MATGPVLEDPCMPVIFWLGVATSIGIGISNAGNDLSNAMGVTVGAKVMTLQRAVMVGAAFDGLGALLMGSRVTSTISGGVINARMFHEVMPPAPAAPPPAAPPAAPPALHMGLLGERYVIAMK